MFSLRGNAINVPTISNIVSDASASEFFDQRSVSIVLEKVSKFKLI